MSGTDGSRRDVDWAALADLVGARLLAVDDPLAACRFDPEGAACRTAVADLRNPFAVEEHPAGFHTTGWYDAFDDRTASHAVAAESSEDVASALAFARANGVRVAVKGTGHDYLGRSSAPGALLIWTHPMRQTVVHESFSPAGSPPDRAGVPALTVEAGTRWLEAYRALEGSSRVAAGGGCTTVGAAGGFTMGGGYSSFARRFGTAAGNVLEMEVVTADAAVRVVNEHQHPDLFWALRGGGGGTFGVVTKVTYATHPAPVTLGGASGTIRASTERAYRALVDAVVERMPLLATEHWGEQVRFRPDRTVELTMTYLDLPDDGAREVWQPLFDWAERQRGTYATEVFMASGAYRGYWDAAHWLEIYPDIIRVDPRPRRQHPGDFWWTDHEPDTGRFVNSYQSRWLPLGLVRDQPREASEALYRASLHHEFGIHVNKALAGAAPEAVARDRTTSINPAVFDALGLVICASLQPFTHPGVPGHEPDLAAADAGARAVTEAMTVIRSVSPRSGPT